MLSPEECTLKTRLTHILKQSRPHLCHQKSAHKNQANSQTEARQASLCHQTSTSTIRPTHLLKQDRPDLHHQKSAHCKNQANSQTETRQARSVSPEECTLKIIATHFLSKMATCIFRMDIERDTNSPPKKRMGRLCVLELCKIKCKKAYFLK